MKIFIKMIIAIVIGIFAGIFLNIQVDGKAYRIIELLTDISVNCLLYFTLLYILVKTYTNVIQLRKAGKSYLKLIAVFIICLLFSLFLSIIVSIGIMNIALFQPESFTIIQDGASPIKPHTFYQIVREIVNTNFFKVFEGDVKFLYPVIFASLIFAYGTLAGGKKSELFLEIIQSFETTLDIIISRILDIFPFISIFAVVYLVVKVESISLAHSDLLTRPLFAILVVVLILFVFYTVFLTLIYKRNIGLYYTSIIGAGLVGLVTGNRVTGIIALNEHLEKNSGIHNGVSGSLTSLGLVLNRTGTLIVATIILFTLILGFSPNILTINLQISIFWFLILFSFRLDGSLEPGFLILISLVLKIPSLHLEENSYILFLVFAPILSRIAIFVDIITTGIFITISAKLTNSIRQVEYKEFI